MHNLHITFKILLHISFTVLSFNKHIHTKNLKKFLSIANQGRIFTEKFTVLHLLKLLQICYAGVSRNNDLHVQCY